ncbi:MAG: hypothetical protein U1F35_03900 [Steroidobacteraceae bacterium]
MSVNVATPLNLLRAALLCTASLLASAAPAATQPAGKSAAAAQPRCCRWRCRPSRGRFAGRNRRHLPLHPRRRRPLRLELFAWCASRACRYRRGAGRGACRCRRPQLADFEDPRPGSRDSLRRHRPRVKDLFVLEEELLFPANTQVAVFCRWTSAASSPWTRSPSRSTTVEVTTTCTRPARPMRC